MADQRISQLPAITGANMADTDQFVVARASTSENFSVTRAEVFKDIPTLDATTLEVTNLKAKDGTAAGSIANTTGVVTLTSSVLTTADINGGTIDGTVIGGATPAAGSFTTASTTGDLTIADRIVHNGDTNTAIRFPAADTVTVDLQTSLPSKRLIRVFPRLIARHSRAQLFRAT